MFQKVIRGIIEENFDGMMEEKFGELRDLLDAAVLNLHKSFNAKEERELRRGLVGELQLVSANLQAMAKEIVDLKENNELLKKQLKRIKKQIK